MDWDIAITLIDTAGIRNTNTVDKVEKIGIEYSKQSISEADLILFLFDLNSKFDDEDLSIYNLVKGKKHIIIGNKSDLPQIANNLPFEMTNVIKISTITQEGISNLKNSIKKTLATFSSEETEFITNKRQQQCLINCKDSMERALDGANKKELQDMISIDLKSALLALDEITGEVITDEILDNIFSHFCIGK